MSRDRNRSQEYWEEPTDDDFPEVDERSRKRTRRRYGDGEREFYPHQRRRRAWPYLLIGCAGGIFILVLVAVVGVFVVAGNGSVGSIGSIGGIGNPAIYTQRNQQSVQLSNITQVQVHNQIGDVSITVDQGATALTVTTVKKVKATSKDDANKEFGHISVQVQPAGTPASSLVVNVTLPDTSGSILNKDSDVVDVAIKLPPSANTNAGAPLTLNVNTSVGSVLVEGLSGVLMVKDSFGNVTVHQATLADGSHLETGTGDVVFDGTLDTSSSANPQPRFKIQAEKGNVNVTLPVTTNVILDANVNVGMINSEFAINVTNTGGSPSYYGPLLSNPPTPPTAVLVLDVSSGNINLHKG